MPVFASDSISCKQFADYLIRRAEHLDNDLIKDVTPTDGWIGHVETGSFAAFDGVSHTFDRINRVYPDLSGCWEDVVAGSCLGTPCDPVEKRIGLGSTRDSYNLQRKSYGSDLFCFDLMMSADRAVEQMAGYVETLRFAAQVIISDRLKHEALRGAGTKVVANATMAPFTFTTNADCTQITPSVLPTSVITIQMLQRMVQPLMLNGAAGTDPDMAGMFEYVTDMETGWKMREGNTALSNLFRFQDFSVGGKLYKYGITEGMGNFGFRYDLYSLRYQLLADGVTLQEVKPYTNVAATSGIKGIPNDAFINARYQIDFIHNRRFMKTLALSPESVNPMMPFAKRDLGGKWQFVMDNLGADANGCVIENTRRNKGKFIADWVNATKFQRPEWEVAILTLRDRSCITVSVPCNADNGYPTQDYNSANAVCPNPNIDFEITAAGPTYTLGNVYCNGVLIAHGASVDTTLAALVTFLNTNLSSLGTWSNPSGTILRLAESTCNSVSVTVT